MHHRGYAHAVATANCGRPAGQYDVALVDWRRRPFRTLEKTLDWILNYMNSRGSILIWVDPQKPGAIQHIHGALEKRGFMVEKDTIHECGCAVSARRRATTPLRKAA
jgi:acetolactate synthase regulatory subunit